MPLSNGQRICNAHKRDGTRCGQAAITGKEKCKMHGGKTLSGAANGNYRSGRYSRSLPTQLAQRYEAARTNPRLLSVLDDIALAEARLAQLLEQVGTGESGAQWQAVKATWTALGVAMRSGDDAGVAAHFRAMDQLLAQGTAEAGLWQDIQEVWASRCKLVQTETKTLLGLQQLITVQQHMLMLGAVTDAVVQAVQAHADQGSARKILMQVEADFTRLATLGDP
jgi:hypothetical protein